MANLNLSQFGENSSVSDADYTFVWDSANSISKKVSRNSWLNSGTLTSSAPVTISQTWDGTVSTVFKALVVNAVSTASAAGSFLLDLQLGGVSKFSVYKDGNILLPNAATIGNAATSIAIGTTNIYPTGSSGSITTLGTIGAPFLGAWFGPPSQSAFLTSDSLNTLALRNGAAAQTFRVYNTYTDASNYERGLIGWVGGIFEIGSQAAGTGATRHTRISSVNTIAFATSGIERWRFSSAGNLTADADNQYDIGASGANRPKDIYLSNRVYFQSGALGTGTSIIVGRSGGSYFQFDAVDGCSLIGVSAPRINFGGTNNLFPAIKRNAAGLDIVLANDSGFAAVQDLYRRFGAGTPEGVVTAPIGAVYHNTTGGAGTSFYVKESGTGNTGWVGK